MTQALHAAIQEVLYHFPSERALAEALDIPRGTVKHWLDSDPGTLDYERMEYDPAALYQRVTEAVRRAGYEAGFTAGQQADVNVPVEEEAEVDGNTLRTVTTVGDPVRSLDDAIEQFDVDTSVWYPKRWKCQAHEGPIKPKRSQVVEVDGQERLTSEEAALKVVYYKVWVEWERNRLREGLQAFTESLLEDKTPPEEDIPGPRPVRGELLSMIHIPDLHFGNLIFSNDGSIEWDLNVGAEQYRAAYTYLLSKAADEGAGEVGCVIGSDAAHANSSSGRSANGTQYIQTIPSKMVFRALGPLYMWTVRETLRHCPIRMWGVSGNHDDDPADNMACALAWRYSDWRDVHVHAEIDTIKAHVHGQTFIGLAHGKTRDGKTFKAQDFYNFYTDRFSDQWHATTYREVLTGHLHKREASRPGEYVSRDSLLVRISPTLCPPDRWHTVNGYGQALRAAEVFHYHPEFGLVGHHQYTPELMTP